MRLEKLLVKTIYLLIFWCCATSLGCNGAVLNAQDNSDGKVKAKQTSEESEWKCNRVPPPGRIETPGQRWLLECSCRRERKNSEREYLDIEIFEVDSDDAAKSLSVMKAGLEMTERQSEPYKIGDEGYFTKFKIADVPTVAIYFRKKTIVVYVGGDSLSNVQQFAEFVEKHGEKEFERNFCSKIDVMGSNE